jgi:hypothetical protein
MKKKIKITPDMAVVLEGRIKAFRYATHICTQACAAGCAAADA